jgi:hypothetical protein
MVDQETRDPSNPYNLVDEARRIRELRAGEVTPESATAGTQANAGGAPAPTPRSSETARLTLGESDLRDLVKLVSLRQQLAPAQIVVEDIHERPLLFIQLAYSGAFETAALQALNAPPERVRILVFTARSTSEAEFYPNFLFTQNGATFRPDPLNAAEVHFLVGRPGTLAEGHMAVGYLRVPARFDPSAPMQIFWNDHNIDATLDP